MLKYVAALALAASSIGATSPDEPRINYNAIALIECGRALGTAWWRSRDSIITAAHVVSNGPCSIDGTPLEIVRQDGGNDIAELRGLSNPNFLRVDCRGPREGRVYYAVGYAQGRFRHSARLLASRVRDDGQMIPSGRGMALLYGSVFHGMSGGPVIGRNGRVVGITNQLRLMPPTAASRVLGDTFVCGRDA